ncbi:hypothetical protein PYV61_26515, partial [Roseisolibacter sp. H3M3-2]
RARLALGLLAVVAAWRRPSSRGLRLAALLGALAAVAVAPLNVLSNVSSLFDPALYFAAVGGPFTASMGALMLTGAVLLLGLFTLLRADRPLASRPVAAAIALAVAAVAPFLLRALSRGITPPALGAPVSLWLAWEVSLFLAAAAVLLAGVAAGRAATRGASGLHPLTAPVLAGTAAA